MQFKSLQIQGFKSFVDKTLIEFPTGITAIVGPNGSGKSNIMDALRWVFGEQRASELRGGDMEDVIFAGSEKRRPAGYAEVALTMSDLPQEVSLKWGTFSEITISRKIYRTGEREYFINGRKCRLKDIRDIFFDTGLGAKSISIIEQERVTKIVNSTPEELRYFLEETAGVVRYKERRREAESRLRQAQDNLSRINDLLSIMAEDMEKLNIQVEQVKCYKALRDKKTGFEKTFFCVTYGRYLKEKQQHKAGIDENRALIASLVGENQAQINLETDCEAKQHELRDKIKDMRIAYDDLKQALSKTEGDIRQFEANLENAEQQKSQLAEDLENSQERLLAMEERRSNLKAELENVEELIEVFSEQVEEHSEAMHELRSMLERANEERREINTKYLSATQRLTDATNKVNLKQAEINSHENTEARLKRELESIYTELDSIKERLESSSWQLQELEDRREELKSSSVEAQRAWQEKERERNSFQEKVSVIDVERKTLLNQIDFIKDELNAKLAGESGSILFSDYGGKLYINVVDCDDATSMLYGDLIVFDDAVRERLFAEMEQFSFSFRFIFNSEMEKLRESEKITALSSTLFYQGAVYKKIGTDDPVMAMLQLQDRLKDKETKQERLNIEFESANNELLRVNNEMEALYERYSEQAEQVKEVDLEYSTVSANLKNMQEQNERLLKNVNIVEKERALARDGIEIAKQEIEVFQIEREKHAQEQLLIDEERTVIDDKIDNLNDLLEDKRDEHAAADRELAKYSERRAAMEAEKKQLEQDHENTSGVIFSLKKRLSDLVDIHEISWKESLEKAVELKHELTKQVITASDEVAKVESEQLEVESTLAAIRSSLGGINSKIHEIELSLAERQGKFETVETNLKSIEEQVLEHFNEDVSVIWESYAKESPSRQRISEEIIAVQAEIDALGPLNMAAEEEFGTKSKQFHEQTEQQKDIEKAIVNLNELIQEIDESTVKLFEDTFYAVKKNFLEVFTRFFGSGSADLSLTEPDNMLNTGVELSINPPGKKVSHKNLLSGGEKALAALTLLFALFLQKPTPFCFLDEVDAPLDDANAGRFIAMVKSMSYQTQFVIITHKHQTMAAADSLYGVTMQEGGVSTMLSVEIK